MQLYICRMRLFFVDRLDFNRDISVILSVFNNFSLIWRRHHYRWRAACFDLCYIVVKINNVVCKTNPMQLYICRMRLFFVDRLDFNRDISVILSVFNNFSLIWRRHHYRWRAACFDLCSALMAVEQWWFFSVPHILWHGTSIYNGLLRGTMTLTRFLFDVDMSRLGFKHQNFHFRGERCNPLRHRRCMLIWVNIGDYLCVHIYGSDSCICILKRTLCREYLDFKKAVKQISTFESLVWTWWKIAFLWAFTFDPIVIWLHV